jgi:hypothetical protein
MKRLVHFGAATASAYLYAQMTPMLLEFLLKLSNRLFNFPRLCYSDCEGDTYQSDYSLGKFCWFTSWLLAYFICEFANRYKKDLSRPRILNHLCYGPLIAFAVFLFLAPVAEWEAIEKSKWKIRDYLENGSTSDYGRLYIKELREDESVWSSPEYQIYAETAAEGLQSANPMTRVRALELSSQFYNWIERPYRSPFIEALQKGRNDKDIIFREDANEYIRKIYADCAGNDCPDCYFLRKALSPKVSSELE